MIGVDLSNYQAALDISTLKSNGYSFAILKATEGTTFFDKSFRNFVTKANQIGLPIGAYCFSHATSADRAEAEAGFIVNQVRGFDLPLGIYIDIETPEQLRLSGSQLQDVAEAFCRVVRAAGYIPGIYSSEYGAWSKLNRSTLPKDVVLWVAHYGKAPAFDCDIWQKSDTGRVSGYNGPVDLDEVLSERFEKMVNGAQKDDSKEPDWAVKPGMVYPPNPTVLAFQLWLNYNGYECPTDGQKTKAFFKILREFVDDMESC